SFSPCPDYRQNGAGLTGAMRRFSLAHILDFAGHGLLPGAPARAHAEGCAVEDGLYAADLALFHPEQLGDLPGPVDAVVVEEREGENNAALPVHGHETPVANPVHDALEAFLELLPAGGSLAAARQHVDAVLETHAVVGEGVVAPAVVVLQAGEIVVGGLDQVGAGHALGVRNRRGEDAMGRTHGLHA